MAEKSRVLLITTGICEARGLPESLAQIFPTLAFESIQRDSFTSSTLRPVSPEPAELPPQVSSLAQKLAVELVAAVEPGQRTSPPEMVIVVDDLELANVGNEETVLAHMRRAVHNHLTGHAWPSANSRERAMTRVRERCSFHLLVPMLEAYFFGEPQPAGIGSPRQGALQRAGAIRPSFFDLAQHDVEAFWVDEPDYCDRYRVPDGTSTAHWATKLRERHPKQYVRFLCNPEPRNLMQTPYREGTGGVQALRSLNWHAVLSTFPQRARFARSLFADIADRFNLTQPFPGDWAVWTAPKAADEKNPPILRNL